jgi:hypothetical protein
VTVNAGKDRVTLNKAGRYNLRASTRWPAGGTAGTETQTAIRRYNSANVLQEVVPQGSPRYAGGDQQRLRFDGRRRRRLPEVWTFQASTIAKVPDNGPDRATRLDDV